MWNVDLLPLLKMKKLKKAIKLVALVCLILLATIGVGISGGIPLPFSNKRKDTPDIQIELVESDKEDTEVKEFESIN